PRDALDAKCGFGCGERYRLRRDPSRSAAADESGEQFAAGADVVVAVKVFDVDVNGIRAEAHSPGDLLFAVADEQAFKSLALPRRQAVAPRRRAPDLLAEDSAKLGDEPPFALQRLVVRLDFHEDARHRRGVAEPRPPRRTRTLRRCRRRRAHRNIPETVAPRTSTSHHLFR